MSPKHITTTVTVRHLNCRHLTPQRRERSLVFPPGGGSNCRPARARITWGNTADSHWKVFMFLPLHIYCRRAVKPLRCPQFPFALSKLCSGNRCLKHNLSHQHTVNPKATGFNIFVLLQWKFAEVVLKCSFPFTILHRLWLYFTPGARRGRVDINSFYRCGASAKNIKRSNKK